MLPPSLRRTLLAAGHEGQLILPLREQLAGKGAHGVESGWRDSARWLSVLDAMHRQAAGRSARIGFDSRHVSTQHTDAGMLLEQVAPGLLDQPRVGRPGVDAVDEIGRASCRERVGQYV